MKFVVNVVCLFCLATAAFAQNCLPGQKLCGKTCCAESGGWQCCRASNSAGKGCAPPGSLCCPSIESGFCPPGSGGCCTALNGTTVCAGSDQQCCFTHSGTCSDSEQCCLAGKNFCAPKNRNCCGNGISCASTESCCRYGQFGARCYNSTSAKCCPNAGLCSNPNATCKCGCNPVGTECCGVGRVNIRPTYCKTDGSEECCAYKSNLSGHGGGNQCCSKGTFCCQKLLVADILSAGDNGDPLLLSPTAASISATDQRNTGGPKTADLTADSQHSPRRFPGGGYPSGCADPATEFCCPFYLNNGGKSSRGAVSCPLGTLCCPGGGPPGSPLAGCCIGHNATTSFCSTGGCPKNTV